MNKVIEHLGSKYPIIQAPMGWIARSQLASAVSNAGGFGVIETSSGEVDACKEEIKKTIEGSDLVIIHTEWNDFKSINFKNLVRGKKFIIFDMRNIYSPTKIKDQGFRYFSVGQ